MKLKYLMDISDKSFSINHTPSLSIQKLPFYIYDCGHFHANNTYFTEREGLENNYLLIYTLSGIGYLKYKDNEYEIKANQIFVINCYEYHYYSNKSDTDWNFKWVHFSGTAANEYYRTINGDSFNIITLSDSLETNKAMDTIYEHLRQNDLFLDIKLCNYIMNILTDIITCMHSPENTNRLPHHKAEIDKAILFMTENYKTKIHIDDIIDQLHISKYHFSRLFKEYTGLSLYEYLNNYRIGVAKEILKTTDHTVSQISFLVGFNDVNSFIRYFKNVVGTTPTNYRKYWLY